MKNFRQPDSILLISAVTLAIIAVAGNVPTVAFLVIASWLVYYAYSHLAKGEGTAPPPG